MDKTNDYETAKSECWRLLCNSCIIKGATRDCFDAIFDRAYQLGKSHTQSANGLANERLQVAAMAMQGLLSSNIWMKAIMREADPNSHSVDDSEVIPLLANKAVALADALLTELNKDNNG